MITLRKRDGQVVSLVVRRCWTSVVFRRLDANKGQVLKGWVDILDKKGIHGLGLLLADRWIEILLDVKHVCERMMVGRVIVGGLC